MLRVPISPADLPIIRRDRFYHPHPHIMVRMHALALHHEGENATRIAVLLHRNRKTIQTCLKAYRDGGLQGLSESEATERYLAELTKRESRNKTLDCKLSDLQSVIQPRQGIARRSSYNFHKGVQ